MKSLQQCLDQMSQLMDELIQVATKLRDATQQVISEEELAPLQKRQDDLLSQLEEVDKELQVHYGFQIDAPTKETYHNQLQIFQRLNQEFMQNLNASHGLIQFELHRLEEKEEDFLNKILPPPDSAKTIDAKEDEQGR